MRSSRITWIGLVGSLLLCVSAWLTAPQPWGLGFASRDQPMAVRWVQTAPAAVGVVLLFAAWLTSSAASSREIWRRFWIWSVPLLVCPPLLSKDVWAYLEQGWIVAQGFNPYTVGLGTIGGPFGEFVDAYWQQTTTVYPPLALLIQAGVVALSQGHPLVGALLMRLPGLLSVVAIGAVLPRIARRIEAPESRALWWGLVNPLVLVHFIGGAHNDAWGLALAIAGLWLAVRWPRAWWAGSVLVGLAMAVKQPLGLWLVPVALIGLAATGTPRQAWRDVWGRAAVRLSTGLIGVAAGFALPTLASGWGLAWATGSGAPQSVGSQSLAHTLSDGLRILMGADLATAHGIVDPIVLGGGLAVMIWLGWRHAATSPVTFVVWGLCVFALAYPSLQPWYLLWGGIGLGLVDLRPGARRWVIGAVAGFLVTSVALEAAGWPIPVAQAVAIGVCVLVASTTIFETKD